jgi:hypothetical protein
MRRTAVMIACLLVTGIAGAQSHGVYKWKDANGVTHYTDTPPPKSAYTAVAANAAARVQPPPKPDPRCGEARANVDRIRNSPGEVGPDANGDGKPDIVLDQAQRARQLQAAEAQVASYCAATAP